MDIVKNIESITASIPEHVKLIAVSKTKPEEMIMQAYKAGYRIFGENKVQELVRKHEALPKDIEWHLIGHLQTNKVKYVVPFVSLIHAVDSFKLLKTINKEAERIGKIVDCLFQLKIAKEESKFGMTLEQAKTILESSEYKLFRNIRLTGLMGMATFTEDQNIIRSEFQFLHSAFNELKNAYFNGVNYFKELSMGMSDDYGIAIEAGSTMIRVGSKIFGARNYSEQTIN